MGAIVTGDVSIANNGDIRWEGAATTPRHTVLEFIQFLMDLQDDEQAAGDDLLDITVDTPFNRSTDQILTLNSPFNVDDTFITHLFDGSVSQTEPVVGGQTLYSGLAVIGPVESGTEFMILQNGKILPAFWGSGINPEDAPSLVFSRHLVKSRFAGVDIDGQRITVLARELGDQYRRFPVTLGTGNSVAAVGNGADIFNAQSDATIAGFTSVANTEGFQELNLDAFGAAGQEFYSQWTVGVQSVNDTYERTKWISQRSHDAEDSGAQIGTDYVIANGTINAQAQEWISTAEGEYLTEARLFVQEGGGTPTGTVYAELYISDDAAAGLPTGTALARSEGVLASQFTTSYEETIFRFNRFNPADGTSQSAGLTLAVSQQYFIALRNAEADATSFFEVRGFVTGTFASRNKAVLTGSTWSGQAAEDLDLLAKTSPVIHDIPGEIFQGISIEVGYDGEAGAGVIEDDIVMWGTLVAYDALVNGPFRPGELVTFVTGSSIEAGGVILFDDATDEIVVALDTLSAIDDNYVISSVRAAGEVETTAAVNGALVDGGLGGGEGILLAKDDNGPDGEVYLQVLTGVDPVEDNRIRTDDVTGDPLVDFVDATAVLTTRTLIPEYLGTSTGANIIGAYGIGFLPGDVGSSDRFTSLDDASRIPPNNVIFTVSALASGEDRVLVGPRTGALLDRGQWLLGTTLSGAGEVLVIVTTGTDTVPWVAGEINWPSTGESGDVSALRIELNSGIYRNVDYTSHDSVDRFVIPSTNFGADNAASGNNVFLAFIDVLASAATETFTGVHTPGSDRDLFVRVRDGGATPIKTFESASAQFLASPQTIAAVRTSDA